jgi:16S rRNA (cytosine967-C5)-methyltransferase
MVLDISSAPGGKTTHIAELVGKSGVVVAGDSSPRRIPKVIENSQRLRVSDRVATLVMDGVNIPLLEKFDKILLDAPCSGTGVIRRHPDSRWIRKEEEIKRAVKLQAELLDSAADILNVGGVMVYSTCSLEREENFGQVEKFLERHPEFELEDASEYIDSKLVSMDRCLFITPQDHGLDGMFGARLVKRG